MVSTEGNPKVESYNSPTEREQLGCLSGEKVCIKLISLTCMQEL